MIALISLFVIVTLSLLVTRVATQMLVLTGLSKQSAQFQARSAFSGAGFTTSESESVLNHPVRRRIIRALILLGNAGIVSAFASLLLSFTGTHGSSDALLRIGLIAVFLVVLLRVANSAVADRVLNRVIERALRKFTAVDVRDYASLLRLSDDWMVAELAVEEGDWLCGFTLRELRFPDEGVLVLGIVRSDGRWVGAPKGTARLRAGDTVTLYGKRSTITRIDERERSAAGEQDWLQSQIEFTEAYLEQQQAEDQEARSGRPCRRGPPSPARRRRPRRERPPDHGEIAVSRLRKPVAIHGRIRRGQVGPRVRP